MQAEQQNRVSITIPFLVDYCANEHQSCDVENARGAVSITGRTSFFKTTFNGVNVMSGVGILSIPYALLSGGWLSLILLFVIASATFYTGFLIKRCMEVDPNIRSYPDIGDKAFGTKGRLLVSIFMNLELYLVATGLLILAGDNLHNLFPNVEVNIYGIIMGGRKSFILLSALVIMPTVWIDNMTTLSYISATGVVACVVILGSVLWSGVIDEIGFHKKGELLNWSGLPTAISLYAFCYCGHPVFPTLYTSMRNQRQFCWVLFLCFFFCTVTYVSMAILGYAMFGSELQSQITLNLPTNKFSSKVAICTVLMNPIAKYALMLKPIVDATECHFQSHRRKRLYILFTRCMLFGSSAIVALSLPFFGSLMSLIGAFLNITVSILLPCFFYLKISGAYWELGFELAYIGFTVLMGLLVLIIGTYTSLIQIIQNLYMFSSS